MMNVYLYYNLFILFTLSSSFSSFLHFLHLNTIYVIENSFSRHQQQTNISLQPSLSPASSSPMEQRGNKKCWDLWYVLKGNSVFFGIRSNECVMSIEKRLKEFVYEKYFRNDFHHSKHIYIFYIYFWNKWDLCMWEENPDWKIGRNSILVNGKFSTFLGCIHWNISIA